MYTKQATTIAAAMILFILLTAALARSQISFSKFTVKSSVLNGKGAASGSWIDGKPRYLEINSGCEDPSVPCGKLFLETLFSFAFADTDSEWVFFPEFSDSLSAGIFAAADIDNDGQDEIIVRRSTHFISDSTFLYLFDQENDKWNRFGFIFPKIISLGLRADILDVPGEELVFTYANDPELSPDMDEWDPRVGIAIMAWDSGTPVFYLDGTQRYGVAGIGRGKADPYHFYFVEGFLESDEWSGDRVVAHMVKYAFSPNTKQFTELYRTRSFEPNLSRFQGGGRQISVKDSVISVLKRNIIFRYVDTGSELRQLDVQQVDTLLMDSFWFDYDMDGTDEIFGSQYSLAPLTPSARFSLVYYEEVK